MSNASGRVLAAAADPPAARDTFDAFYRRSYPDALRLAWLLTGSRAAAEDVVHDALAGVFTRFDELRLPAAYLRRAVVNRARSWQRDERRHRERVEAAVEPVEWEEGASRELLAAALALPYRQRVVVVARYWGGWSEAEIADALGCRPGTVKSLASRALERLRKEMDP